MYNIGQISELTGYSQRMLRFLEEQGLVKPIRDQSAYRVYSDQDCTRITTIKRLKGLGFSYSEIKSFIDKDSDDFLKVGTGVLERHHQEAEDLKLRIEKLEGLVGKKNSKPTTLYKLGTSLGPVQRTAYRINDLSNIYVELQKTYPTIESSFNTWKFRSYLDSNSIAEMQEAYEIFHQSAFLIFMSGADAAPEYFSAWKNMPFQLNPVKFLMDGNIVSIDEFFGDHDLVIEHEVRVDNKTKFLVLLPYQSVFAACSKN